MNDSPAPLASRVMGRPGKIVCVGRNYAAHARELGNDVPERPLLFLKPPSSVIGEGGVILLPAESERVEHEGEIGVVIGRRMHRAGGEEVMRGVAGYVALNDVTARDLQRQDVQFTRAKGFDTFCPVGSPGPAGDWKELEIVCRVNGSVRQHGYAADMTFGIPDLLVYISRIMTLEAGDIIATGTPEGVGPLRPGDDVQVEIPGVSSVRNTVRAEVET